MATQVSEEQTSQTYSRPLVIDKAGKHRPSPTLPKFKIEVQVLDEGRRMFRGGWKPLGA